MSYRRAFVFLILIIFVASAAAYVLVSPRFEAPPWSIAIATVIAVGGGILALLPNMHDATQFVQGMLSGERQKVIGRSRYQIDNPNQQRNRENFLANMYHTWVEGALNNALHNAVLIELGLSMNPEAVGRSAQPWNMLVQRPNDSVLIPTEKRIDELFAEHGRSLLILGMPGSGKTITLLQLARVLIAEAQDDPARPMPVVLNLSSWAQRQLPFEQWIAEEMYVQYQVPSALTETWLEHDHLALLLDGLDEVARHRRNECIIAINVFRKSYAAEMVVCSRAADYDELSQRLNLATAVRIQPLTPVQIHNYLRRFGSLVRGFQEALQNDEELQKLAGSPLVLSLVPMAYADLSQEEIPHISTTEAAHRPLFERYVRQMFRRRPLPPGVQLRAINWLHNLAQGMSNHNESVFYIERLQGSWLPDKSAQRYQWQVKSIVGLIMGLIVGLINGLINGLIDGLIWGLIWGLIGGLIADTKVELVENLTWSMPSWGQFGRIFAMVFWGWFLPILSIGIVTEFGWGVLGFVATPFSLTLAVGGVLVTLYRLFGLSTEELIGGLIWGLILGLILGLINGLIWGLILGLIDGLILGLILGLINGLIWGLVFGGFYTQETQQRSQPNQGIRQSILNSMGFLLAGTLGGIIFGLILWLLNGELLGIVNFAFFRSGGGIRGGLIVGMPLGLFFGYIGAKVYGADTFVKHYLLRWLLYRHQVLPFFRDRKLVSFLDEMAARIVLRRVGGGWQFVHRYFLEYFASLTPQELQALSEDIHS